MSGLANLALLAALLAATSCSGTGSGERAPGRDPSSTAPTASSEPRARDAALPAEAAAPLSDLTLERALVMAREGHPELEAARASLDATRARLEGSGLWPNPEAIAIMEAAPISEGSTTGDAEYILGFSQPVPLGDRLERERALAAYARDRAVREVQTTLRTIERDVRGAFGTVVFAQRVVEARREYLDTSQRMRELIEARVSAGDAVPADLSGVELQEVRDRFELQRAEALNAQALLTLGAAMGTRAPIERIEGDLTALLQLPSLVELLDALDGNPELMAAEAGTQVARARVDLAEALRLPDVSLGLFYRRIGFEDINAFDIGLAVPVRLFDDGRASVREEQARLAAAQAQVRTTRLDLEASLRQAHLQARQALAHMAFLEEEIVPRAARLLELTEKRHEAGDAPLEERLAARRTWLDARLGYLEALHEAMAAWARLAFFLESAG